MRVAVFLLPVLALTACLPDEELPFLIVDCETMGTTFSVTVVRPPEGTTEVGLQDTIQTVLADVNGKMSNWDPNSEISLFNMSTSLEPIAISPDMAYVMEAANQVHSLSAGRFDVTLAPLIELWGFGPKQPGDPIPSDTEIFAAMGKIGQFTHPTLDGQTLQKKFPGVTVNLSAIAKGYGVDRVASALEDQGIENYLVEIGGDLVTNGHSPGGDDWAVGIEQPDAASRTISSRIWVPNHGLATSGDYRNYFEEDGVRYSHIIDPTTGRPVTHNTASVTVIAPNAMMADGLATAFLAIGGTTALQIAEANDIALLMINRVDEGYQTLASSAFQPFLLQR